MVTMETSSNKNNDMANKIVAKYISGKVGKSDSFHLNIKRVNIVSFFNGKP